MCRVSSLSVECTVYSIVRAVLYSFLSGAAPHGSVLWLQLRTRSSRIFQNIPLTSVSSRTLSVFLTLQREASCDLK